jgi:hypothetical protein
MKIFFLERIICYKSLTRTSSTERKADDCWRRTFPTFALSVRTFIKVQILYYDIFHVMFSFQYLEERMEDQIQFVKAIKIGRLFTVLLCSFTAMRIRDNKTEIRKFDRNTASKDLRFSRRWLWSMPYFGMLRYVARVRTDVSEERKTPIIRLTRIGELGTLAVTSNRSTPDL